MTIKNSWNSDAIDPVASTHSSGLVSEYPIHLLIVKDDEDSFSAIALNLPGAGSCGSSEEEAILNAKDAVRAVLEEYKSSGEEIPWHNDYGDDIPAGAFLKWLMIDA